MIRKEDVKWWTLEARKHPESAAAMIEELAKRLVDLSAENERLRDEIVRLQHRAPSTTVDSAEVSELQRKVDMLQGLLDGDASAEPSVVLLSHRLESARVPLSRAHRLARDEQPVLNRQSVTGLGALVMLQPHQELLLLTSQGRACKAQPADLCALIDGDEWPAKRLAALESDEWLTAAVAVAQPPRFWTVVTRQGYVRQFLRVEVDMRASKGERLIESPFHNDAPVAVVDGDEGDLLLLTRWGKGIRFSQRTIESAGSVALELEPDDQVVAALSLPSDTMMLILTAAGFAARRNTSQFAARSRPGGVGKTLIQAFDVLGAFPAESQTQLLYLTYSGKLVFASAADVPLHQRSAKGTRLRVFDRDPAVAIALVSG